MHPSPEQDPERRWCRRALLFMEATFLRVRFLFWDQHQQISSLKPTWNLKRMTGKLFSSPVWLLGRPEGFVLSSIIKEIVFVNKMFSKIAGIAWRHFKIFSTFSKTVRSQSACLICTLLLLQKKCSLKKIQQQRC